MNTDVNIPGVWIDGNHYIPGTTASYSRETGTVTVPVRWAGKTSIPSQTVYIAPGALTVTIPGQWVGSLYIPPLLCCYRKLKRHGNAPITWWSDDIYKPPKRRLDAVVGESY